MKIVILDGYAENPGDLSWEWLNEYGEVIIYDRTPKEKILERSIDADILITNKTPLNADTLKKIPKLKFIQALATGYNVIDCRYCTENNIIVCNIPSYSTRAVAQNVFAHILEHAVNVKIHSDSVKDGGWAKCPDFTYHISDIFELSGKTLGIIGYGKIGKEVAKIAQAFNMKVLVNTNHPADSDEVIFTSLDTLIKESDIISLHCPLTDKTEGMVNADFLSKMKPSAILINTSRGPVVNEKDLYEALLNKTIAGAGIDVMAKEPPDKDNPLFRLDNITITPHIAWAGFETRERLMNICKDNFKNYFAGMPINKVN